MPIDGILDGRQAVQQLLTLNKIRRKSVEFFMVKTNGGPLIAGRRRTSMAFYQIEHLKNQD